MNKVLVTGGCGYIGSHTIVDLIDHGYDVISVDNFNNSEPSVLEGIKAITGITVKNYQIDLCDIEKTRIIFQENPDIVGVVHFAAHKSVGESVKRPLMYFRNNLNSLINILECAFEFKIKQLVFSSSCSVYGNADDLPVTEETPLAEPASPYGRTKQMGEQIIRDFQLVYPNMRAVLLRYFNPAGAHESALIGESPVNEASNLIPVITETAIGKRPEMTVFGNDYDTRDGSCVRDYIHIMDLANAHTKAIQYLEKDKQESNYEIFNLGIGQGITVLEAVNAFMEVTGQPLKYKIGNRRPGDVVAIYANYTKASRTLGWGPQYDIDDIMRTAWAWEQRRW